MPNLRTRVLEVDDFNNAFSRYELPMSLDLDVEVTGIPMPKRVRFVSLKIEKRERAKFEAAPFELYTDI